MGSGMPGLRGVKAAPQHTAVWDCGGACNLARVQPERRHRWWSAAVYGRRLPPRPHPFPLPPRAVIILASVLGGLLVLPMLAWAGRRMWLAHQHRKVGGRPAAAWRPCTFSLSPVVDAWVVCLQRMRVESPPPCSAHISAAGTCVGRAAPPGARPSLQRRPGPRLRQPHLPAGAG